MKKIVLLVLISFLITTQAWPQNFMRRPQFPAAGSNPTFDAVATFSSSALCTTATTCTYSHTMGAGSNNIIVIWYFCADGNVASTAVSYNSVAATSIGAFTGLGNARVEAYYVLNQATGAHTVSVSTTCTNAYVASMSAINVNQTTPVRSSTFDGNTAASISETVTSGANDLVLDGTCQGTSITSASGGQTEQYKNNISGAHACATFAGSTKAGASPSVTMGWTYGGSDSYAFGGVSLQP